MDCVHFVNCLVKGRDTIANCSQYTKRFLPDLFITFLVSHVSIKIQYYSNKKFIEFNKKVSLLVLSITNRS